MIITAGSTDVTVPAYFVDDDGGTSPGEPTTGLLFSDIETGGSASYQRQGAARVDFALVTVAVAAAHTDGGFILIDDTNMPGLYRLDVPDLAFATGVSFVIIQLVAAAANNTLMRPLLIDLTAVDLRDGVRGGMTALPDAAADAALGLPISDAGGLDLDARLDAAVSSRLAPTTAARTLDIAATGEVALDLDSTIGTIDAAQIGANAITAAKIATAAITSAKSGVGAINAAAIATDAITAVKIAANAITAAKINASAITSAKFATGAINAAAIATDAITAVKIAANAITSSQLATDAIGAAQFAQGAADKVWSSTARTLTAFSTALALNVWHVLESAIVTASTIGLKLKDSLADVGEPAQGKPPLSASRGVKIDWLFKNFRNKKEQTTNEYRLYDDAGTTVDTKAAVSDAAGVTTKEELATGP